MKDTNKSIKSQRVGMGFSIAGIIASIVFLILSIISKDSIILPLLLIGANLMCLLGCSLVKYEASRSALKKEDSVQEENNSKNMVK